MSKPGENKRPRPAAGEAPGGDWFYDELMTAQPDATREFFRARLLRPAPTRVKQGFVKKSED